MKFLLLIIIFGLAAANAQQHNNPFVEDYIRYLSSIAELNEAVDTSTTENEVESFMATFKVMDKRKKIWSKSTGILEAMRKTTKRELEKTLVESGILAGKLAQKSLDSQMVIFEKVMNGEAEKMGTIAKDLAKFSNDYEEVGKMILMNSIGITHLLIDTIPDEAGKMSYLNISSSERKELANSLLLAYGDEIKSGMKPGMNRIVASGAVVYKFINGEHKSVEKRKKTAP